MDPIEARFSRPEPRRRVRDFVAGLLAPLPTKNCWTIAEHAGDDNPGGMQDLIGRASWDDALVRADVRDFVTRRLGHPDAVLVIDETGDLKKGVHTVGVQRQYSGTAGKIENCQLAVHLTYASPLGHTLVDVALYLPKSWSDDPQRRAEAGVPEHVGFATKPQLARRLIESAVTGGLLCRWVTGDEAYGGDPALATALRGHRFGYVLAVACSHRAPTGLGIQRADQIAAGLPAHAWQRISAGEGAKGHRYYDWAFVTLPAAADQHAGHHWLLIRRNRTNGELAFYRCWSPHLVPLHHLVTVAGRRWSIEESFQAAKTGLGLDQHQHRRWKAWHRWTTLVIAAHAFLAAATALCTPSPHGLIAITVNELRRLFHALVIEPARRTADAIAWSIYRRRHQDAAKTSHYARQAFTEP
ncbi:IS701 family transposase [Plantactinospora sp. KLBMP9567]|uniref:IS701 family transposase n=1 Tax=Plantactinospora sp. KLBMP9567 TaxID=3085900 RepID=UPI002981A68E|nr:IS701 family transposase [Plantactinospora sp. KLBMP9567]MDW5325382.1 IS701 family transposase [Plantactinospora sp. KLBMP9567]MDW5329938.1 IS701 family transposase [Plantactinospora sp. KLBMP9567]MDW5330669.1 IS701 family transposase [Plantactinospora sp. KLBMP9567]MDW5330868.1 IS701 family transposase [Plantactinospora sp. KLBMP9567]